jgi:hypothetical protein
MTPSLKVSMKHWSTLYPLQLVIWRLLPQLVGEPFQVVPAATRLGIIIGGQPWNPVNMGRPQGTYMI